MICAFYNRNRRGEASCDKSLGKKVCWKINDPPRYDARCTFKSIASIFSMHLLKDKCITSCGKCKLQIRSHHSRINSQTFRASGEHFCDQRDLFIVSIPPASKVKPLYSVYCKISTNTTFNIIR